MARKRYSLTNNEKIRFGGFFRLNNMINGSLTFSVLLSGNDLHLEPVLQQLRKIDYVVIQENRYIPTEAGRSVLRDLMQRYEELENKMVVYHSMDLEEGEFALESLYNFDDDAGWDDFLDDDRWEDLRITVLEYKVAEKKERKLMDPVEYVFRSFIKEKRFNYDKPNWQNELLSGEVWDQILEVCNSAIHWQDLGEEEVIEDIIEQGSQLVMDLAEDR